MTYSGWWKGLTSENHLGRAFQMAPQKATNTMVQILALDRGRSLETFLSQFPVKEFENDNEYTWDVVASSRRNIPLVEARNENGEVINEQTQGNVGVNTAPFYLVFPEDWFADGEVIFGHLNEKYPLRILNEPQLEGTNAVYKVELMGGITTGMPVERLLPGERFSVSFAPVEKALSRQVGDVRFATPTSMRNEFSKVRMHHKVEGTTMLNKKLVVGIPVVSRENGAQPTSKIMNMWMHYVDYEVEMQFSDYKNGVLAFGTSNRNISGEYLNIGKSGRIIQMGSGIFEQMEAANVIYYNSYGAQFPLPVLEDAIYELCETKIGFKDRKIVLTTGNRGAVQFHKAILNQVSGWQAFHTDGNPAIIQKVKSDLHSNALSVGFQFVEYKAPNGVVISLNVDPLYDDAVTHKIKHPNGGVAMSYRYDIMSLGSGDEPNIFKCTVKGQPEVRGYQWGFVNPFTGQMNNMHMSYDEDSAVIHKMATLGACVLDATKTISLIPSILQA